MRVVRASEDGTTRVTPKLFRLQQVSVEADASKRGQQLLTKVEPFVCFLDLWIAMFYLVISQVTIHFHKEMFVL